jgi:hypothetical protein
MMRHFQLRASTVSSARALPSTLLLLTLSPALYAQAAATDPAAAPAAPPASAPPASAPPASDPVSPAAPAVPAAAPVAPAADEPAAGAAPAAAPAPAAAAAPAAAPVRKSELAARRRAPPHVTAAAWVEHRSSEANDPSIDLHEPSRAPAQPIPSVAAWLGVGGLWIPSDGLDPFAEDDALAAFSAGASSSLARFGGLDLAAAAGIDLTGSEADYRGEPTSLGLLRLALGPELRGSWLDRLYWHGRVAPTLTRLSLELEESSSGATLDDSQWLWGAEAALGLELRFAEAAAELPHALGFFLRADAGYGWTPGATFALRGGSSAPVRTQPLELGEVALSGPFFRAALGIGL